MQKLFLQIELKKKLTWVSEDYRRHADHFLTEQLSTKKHVIWGTHLEKKINDKTWLKKKFWA